MRDTTASISKPFSYDNGAYSYGSASYPPSYAPGPALDRALRRYIRARIDGSPRGIAVGRHHIDRAIQRAEAGV